MTTQEFIDKWKWQSFSEELKSDLQKLEQSHKAELGEAFYAGREKIKHPDWDYVYESYDDFLEHHKD